MKNIENRNIENENVVTKYKYFMDVLGNTVRTLNRDSKTVTQI